MRGSTLEKARELARMFNVTAALDTGFVPPLSHLCILQTVSGQAPSETNETLNSYETCFSSYETCLTQPPNRIYRRRSAETRMTQKRDTCLNRLPFRSLTLNLGSTIMRGLQTPTCHESPNLL